MSNSEEENNQEKIMRSSDHKGAENHALMRFLKSYLGLIGLILILSLSGCGEVKIVTRDELLNGDITKLEMRARSKPESASFLSNLGWAFLLQGKGMSASSKEFEKALKLDSSSTSAHEGMAYVELMRSNHGKSIGHLIEAIKNRSNHYEIIPLLNLCYSMSELEKSQGTIKKLCNELLGRNDIPMVLKSEIMYILSNILLREGDIEGVKKLRKSLGLFNDWLILGPFDNGDKEGYDVSYPPEAGIDYNRFYKVGDRELKWFKPAVESVLGYVKLDAICYPYKHRTIYSLVYINSPEETDAVIRFGTSAKYKLWLNDIIIAENNQYSDMSFDADAIFVRLIKGWNKVLIKFCNGDGSLGFYFRMTDLMGNALNDLTISTKIEEAGLHFTKAQSPAIAIMPWGENEYFKDLIDMGGEQLFPHFYLGIMYLYGNSEQSVSEKSFVEFKKCMEIAPKSCFFYYFMGNSGVDFNTRANALEKARQLDGECTSSIMLLGKEFVNNGFYRKAQDLLLEAVGKNPEDPLAHYYLGLSLFGMDMDAEGIKRMESVSQLAPYFSNPYYEIAVEGKDLIPFDKQRELLKKALMNDFFNNEARKELTVSYLLKDEVKKAVDLMMDRLKANPYDYAVYQELADLFSRRRDYESGIFYCNKGLEIFKGNPEILAKLGNLKYETGDIQNANRNWQKSLELKRDEEIEKKLSSIGNDKGDFYSKYTRGFETIKEMYIPDAIKKEADKIVLFNQTIRKLNDDYTTWTYHHKVIKILGENALYPPLSIPLVPDKEDVDILEAHVIKEDGSRIDGQRLEDKRIMLGSRGGLGYSNYIYKQVDFTGVEKNSFIEFRYIKREKSPKFYSKKFAEVHFFSENEETILCSYKLIAPETVKMSAKIFNYDKPQVSEEKIGEGLKLYSFILYNIGKIQIEPEMPSIREYMPYLSMGDFSSWDEVSGWYDKISGEQKKSTDLVRAKAEELINGPTSVMDKIKLIHEFVTQDISYVNLEIGKFSYIPFDAGTTLRRAYGDSKDKAALFLAMASSSGIKGNLVLTATTNYGFLDTTIPNPAIFNHAIVYIPDEELWLDLTSSYTAIGELSGNIQDMPCLIIGNGGKSISKIPVVSAEKNLVSGRTEIKIETDGSVKGKRDIHVYGTSASAMRYYFIEKDRGLKVVKEELEKKFNDVKVFNLRKENVDNLDSPVVISYEFSFLIKPKDSNGKLSLQSSLFPRKVGKRYCSMDERVYPLKLRMTLSYDETMIINLPNGYRFEKIPENIKYEGNKLYFDMKYQSLKAFLKREENITIDKKEISSEEYPDFQEFCLMVDAKEEEEIIILP